MVKYMTKILAQLAANNPMSKPDQSITNIVSIYLPLSPL